MIFILLYLYISQNHRKQEIVSDAAFKLWPFSSNFNSACKTGGVTIATCKYYCPLVVNPTITNCCKEFYLKYGRVPRSVFKNVAMHGNYSSFVWKPVFFYYFKMLPPFSKVIVFFCGTFYSVLKYFWWAFATTILFLWISSMVVQSQNYL